MPPRANPKEGATTRYQEVKREFQRLQARANRATLRFHRHSRRHVCTHFICSCGANGDFWPKCVKCHLPLEMFNTDSAPGSFWCCGSGHPQGPMEEGMRCGGTIGWRVPLNRHDNPEIKGHTHCYHNSGGCEELKKLGKADKAASDAFQKFWGSLPKSVKIPHMGWCIPPGGTGPLQWGKAWRVPRCWVKLWYTGTEFDCAGGR
jgi:hypothetical protein